MKKLILATMVEMCGSKKFQAAVLAASLWAVGKLGLDISSETLAGVEIPLLVFIYAQGHADSGKEAAKINASAPAASSAAMISSDVRG